MKNFDGKVAAITGAGSGIGRALAVELARRGSRVAVCDINEPGLRETSDLLDAIVSEHHAALLDVADRERVYTWADEVIDHFGGCNLIFNNAGVSLTATVEEVTYEEFEWLMDINFWGVVYGTKAFLPHLKRSGDGHVVNISSVFGIIGVPTQCSYNAAKFAVKGFTESLRTELLVEGAPVGATSVHPGGIQTNIVNTGRFGGMGILDREPDEIKREFSRLAKTTPESCAMQILKAVEKNKPRVLVGADAKLIDTLQRLLPSRYQDAVVAQYRRLTK